MPDPFRGPQNASTATGKPARRSGRGISPEAWGPVLEALGLVLIVAEDPIATRRILAGWDYRKRSEPQANAAVSSIDQMISDRIRRSRANQLADARAHMVKVPPKVRTAIAKKAACARWNVARDVCGAGEAA